MALLAATAILLLIHVFLKRVATPHLEARWTAETSAGKIRRAGGLAAIKVVTSFTRVASIVFATVLLLFAVLVAVAPLTSTAVLVWIHETSLAIDLHTQWARSLIAQIPFWIGLLGLAYFAYRRWTGKLRGDLAAAYQTEYDTLLAARAAGRLAPLPPTPSMAMADTLIADADAGIRFPEGFDASERQRLVAGQRAHVQGLRDHMDLDRRIDLSELLTPDFTRKSAFGAVLAPLLSKGAEDSVEFAGKLASRLGTALACLLVIGVSAPPLAGLALQPAALRLSDLRVAITQDQAIADIQAYVRDATPACTDCDDEEMAAQAFIRAMSNPAAMREAMAAATPEMPAGRVEELAVRQAVMREYAAASESRPPGTARLEAAAAIEPAPLPGEVVTADSAARSSFENYLERHVVRQDPPRTAAQRLARVFRAAGQSSPRIAAAIHAYAESWRQQRTMWSYAESVIGDAISGAIETAVPDPSDRSFFEKRAWKSGRTALEKGLGRYLQLGLSRALRAAAAGRPIGAALAQQPRVAPSALLGPAEAGEIRDMLARAEMPAERFADAPPRLRAIPTEMEAGWSRLTGRLNQLPETARVAMGGQYDDMPRDSNVERVGRRFNVGGVVIGRMPAATAHRALGWRREGHRDGEDQFAVWLVDEAGRPTQLGTFPAHLILQALAYAADGRPLATTITSAEGLRRIQLHPALLDTRLGCDTIAVDRFVFDGSEGDAWRTEWRTRVEAQLEFYNAAADSDPGAAFTPASLRYYRTAFPDGWRADDARQSIFAYHPGAFDRALVNALLGCRPFAGDAGRLLACLNATRGTSLRQRREYQASSGVRERNARADAAELGAIRDAIDRHGGTGPLQFIEQIAFDGEADCLGAATCRGVFNPAVWSFPVFGNAVQEGVERYVGQSAQRRGALDNVLRFTLLQRVFRGAIAGRFGPAFDRGAIVRLAQDARRAAALPRTITPRFDSTPAAARTQLARYRSGDVRGMILAEALASPLPMFLGAQTCG